MSELTLSDKLDSQDFMTPTVLLKKSPICQDHLTSSLSWRCSCRARLYRHFTGLSEIIGRARFFQARHHKWAKSVPPCVSMSYAKQCVCHKVFCNTELFCVCQLVPHMHAHQSQANVGLAWSLRESWRTNTVTPNVPPAKHPSRFWVWPLKCVLQHRTCQS